MNDLTDAQQEQFEHLLTTPYYWEIHAQIYYRLSDSTTQMDTVLRRTDERAQMWLSHAIKCGLTLV